MKKLPVLFLTCLITFCLELHAQPQFSGWAAMNNTFKIGKKTSIHNDIQWRSSDEFKHTQTFLLRAGLNYHATKKLVLTGGYAYTLNRRVIGDVSGQSPEHRFWEQLLYSHKLKTVLVAHRFRLEQRLLAKSFVENNEIENDGSAYANRFRYFIRNILPFRRQETFSKGMFAALQNEVFLNFGNKANVNGKTFDQNRLYLALGYRLNPSFDLETGYLNQYINGRNDAFVNNHVWQMATYLRL